MIQAALHRMGRALAAVMAGAVLALGHPGTARAAVDVGSMSLLGAGDVDVEVLSGFFNRRTGELTYSVTVTNVSGTALEGTLVLLVDDISAAGVSVSNADDQSTGGNPVFLLVDAGTLEAGASVSRDVIFAGGGRVRFSFDTSIYFAPLITDATPPTLTGSVTGFTVNPSVTVTGSAADAEGAIAGVTATVDTAPGQSFPAAVAPDGSYSVQVPVALGANAMTVTASDTAGNTAALALSTTRVEPPAVVITQPADDARVFGSTIDLVGEIATTLPVSVLTVRFRDRTEQPPPALVSGTVPFRFDAVELVPGRNRLTVVVETPVGSVAASVDVERRVIDVSGDTSGPQITIERPLPGSHLGGEVVVVAGRVNDPSGVAGVTVAGVPARTVGADDTALRFEGAADLAGASGPVGIQVTATDLLGNATTRSVTVERDASAPLIQVAGLQAAPTVNLVAESPYPLAGTVTDANPASLLVNGEPVGLTPGAGPDTYDFRARVRLVPGQTQSLVIQARDLAGNATVREYALRSAATATLEILSPLEGDEILASSGTASVRLVARTGGLPAGATVEALADGGPAVPAAFDGDVAHATLSVTGGAGAHDLAMEARAADGTLLARARVNVDLVDQDTLAVEVIRHEPQNGATEVGVFDPVTLHFNQPIDLADLQVVLRETFHGLTYAPPPEEPAAFGGRGAELLEVHRDREQVPANFSPLPGDRMVSVFPVREFAFGAEVFVDVLYQGATLARFAYRTQPLPTILEGLVADQLLEPVAGIQVILPELGFTGTSNNDGAFSLGSGEAGAPQIPAGRHRLVYNPRLANRAFGTVEKWVNVQGERLNTLGLTTLPILNPDVPFQRIESGQPAAVLAGADLELDLTAATLRFPGGRAEGDVHVQFMNLAEVPHPISAGAIPHWVFAVQPAGIAVDGAVGLRFRIPPLFGSTGYMPGDGARVVLVGFNPVARQLVPVGVGVVQGAWVRGEGAVALESLDYLGYALVEEAQQETLSQFAQGALSLAGLIAALQR